MRRSRAVLVLLVALAVRGGAGRAAASVHQESTFQDDKLLV